jgi:hypothetical protein
MKLKTLLYTGFHEAKKLRAPFINTAVIEQIQTEEQLILEGASKYLYLSQIFAPEVAERIQQFLP